MKYRILMTTILFIGLSARGFSQQDSTLSLSLGEAQEYAITHNLTLENARLDIESAKKKVWETTAIGLPQVSGKLNYQNIPGTIPTFDFVDFETGDPIKMPLAVKNSTTYSFTASQLIFSGEYIVGLQASKTYLQISKLNQEKQEMELKANVLSSYTSILILENNLNIMNTSIKNMETLVNDTKELNKQGFLESTDADQLQITLNTLINAKNTIERQIDVSYKLFKILLGADIESHLVLTENLQTVYASIIGTTAKGNFDVNNNIDFQMLNNQVKVSELSLKREKSTYLPTIAGFYMYQDKTNKASFDFTINNILGVTVDWPLFTSFQRNAKVQQAKIEYKKSLNNRELTEDNLITAEKQLRYNFESALEKYHISTYSVELSKNVFENSSKKYKQGMVSSMDLTQANNNYLQAESDQTTALFELIKTKIELEKILNEL